MRPLSVEQIANRLQRRGDQRDLDTIKVFITRAIQSGSLAGAYKVNPNRQTSPWLVPAEEVDRWLNAG